MLQKQHQRGGRDCGPGRTDRQGDHRHPHGIGTDIGLLDDVKKGQGLAIIGTEGVTRVTTVDRQLRGRSGRSGDQDHLYSLSLEDKLMRLFGSGKIAGVMDKMGSKEGEVIESSGLEPLSVHSARWRRNHYGVRKRLLEYDDVMNAQRDVI